MPASSARPLRCGILTRPAEGGTTVDMSADPHLTLAEFLEWEQRQESKHEFVAGRVVAFAGGTLGHTFLASLLIVRIHPRAAPCRTFGSDALIQTGRSFRYADVVVSCDERDRDPAARVVVAPKTIVEVLSESTAAIDRGEKLDEYRTIETLAEYVLLDSRKRWCETYRRVEGAWLASLPIVEGELVLESLEIPIDLNALYDEAGIE